MESLQEPWTKEEWDAWVKHVLVEGDTPAPDLAFDSKYPVGAQLHGGPLYPLDFIQKEQEE